MSELIELSKKTELKILKYAVAIIREHGSIAGDRICQDWSIDAEEIESPEAGFSNEEQKAISFNYEQWNSNGTDYNTDHMFFHDEMSVSFMLSYALEQMINKLDKKEVK